MRKGRSSGRRIHGLSGPVRAKEQVRIHPELEADLEADLRKEAEVDALIEMATLERRAGGNLTAEAVGKLLGLSQEAVEERRRAGALLAMPQGGGWTYPRAQFHEKDVVPGLAEVVHGFGDSGPWVTLEFLVSPDDALDGLAPRDALLKGGEMRERVMTLVRGQREGEGFA